MMISYKGTPVTLGKVFNVIIAYYRKWFRAEHNDLLKAYTDSPVNEESRKEIEALIDNPDLKDHDRIPLVRMLLVQEKSPACIALGSCVECKCPIPDKFYEQDACEKGCYKKWPL